MKLHNCWTCDKSLLNIEDNDEYLFHCSLDCFKKYQETKYKPFTEEELKEFENETNTKPTPTT